MHLLFPAAISLHTTGSCWAEEIAGFTDAGDIAQLGQLELICLTVADGTTLVRGRNYHRPVRRTLLPLSDTEHVLYTRGSVRTTRPYPGIYIPRTRGTDRGA